VTDFPIGIPGGQQAFGYARDTDNDYELYDLDSDTPNDFPASTVKLMTAHLAIGYKSGVLDTETVTITTADVTDPFGGGSTSAGFQAGDIVTWRGLLQGLLIASGFDAAQAIARVIGSDGAGAGGMAAFVATMNTEATILGMTNSTFVDPFGGSFTPTTPPYDTSWNIMSTRDLATVCVAAYASAALRTIQSDSSVGVPVTGLNPRTITMSNFSWWANMPIAAPAGIRDTGVLAGKQGYWAPGFTSITSGACAVIWESPSGVECVVATMGSKSLYCIMLDARGLIYGMPRDFPYLDLAAGPDPNWTDVQLLIGADGSIVDESNAARALTNGGVTMGDPVNATEGALFVAFKMDYLTAADAPSLTVGSGDMTAEVWFAGIGVNPGSIWHIVKWEESTNNREWALSTDGFGNFFINASADGTAVTFAQTTIGSNETLCYYNGAPRHLAIVKEGSTWALYLMGERQPTTFSLATAFDGTAPVGIGSNEAMKGPKGSTDDLRVTIGVARYTADAYTLYSTKFPRE
jgi:hypothetical protein